MNKKRLKHLPNKLKLPIKNLRKSLCNKPKPPKHNKKKWKKKLKLKSKLLLKRQNSKPLLKKLRLS